MSVQPSLEWKKKYKRDYSSRNAEHGDKDMPPSARQIKTGEGPKKGQQIPGHDTFIKLCDEFGVKPTIRQARKFKQKRGKFAKV